MKLIIAGSRTFGACSCNRRGELALHQEGCQFFAHQDLAYEVLDEIRATRHEHGDEIIVVSGMARGGDKMGELWADERRLKLIRMPANWDKYGKSAGYRRNEEMEKVAHGAIIFWDGISRGSMHMRDIMKRAGKRVKVVLFD